MGRTNPTYRDILHSVLSDWKDYRRSLRRPDQDRFDQMFRDAHQYADAGGYLNHPNPMVVVLFSICLAQQKRIENIEAELEIEQASTSAADEGEASPSD